MGWQKVKTVDRILKLQAATLAGQGEGRKKKGEGRKKTRHSHPLPSTTTPQLSIHTNVTHVTPPQD